VQWFGPGSVEEGSVKADIDLRVGGRYRISFKAKGTYNEVGGVYREVVPNQRLVFSWAWHSTPERESLVTISMKPEGSGTLLTFLHEQFADTTARDNQSADGWNCWPSLKAIWKANWPEHRSRPCSRTASSPARSGSPPARRTLRMRRNTPRRASAWPKSAARCHGSRSIGIMCSTDPMERGAGRPVQGRSQLVVQHVMFAPDWNEACKSCSFWRRFERMVPHLAARDTTMVAISRAPLPKLTAFKQRMGWTFDWLSSGDNDFNYDYGVSFTPEQIERGGNYNFGTTRFGSEEAPGISVFYRDEAGNIFHTYSCFARGLDMMNAAYHYPRPDPARAS
jgi:uncharacterized protein YndB with AHSA1/START domain